jgi:beta-glucosidase
MGWEIHPESFERVLRWARDRYGDIPLYVTENGAAFDDGPLSAGGRVEDTRRVEYLRGHLLAARAAIRAGVDLRGYFAWSLLDNYEWAEGFSKRFGLVHVDPVTLRRTPKDSARFFAEVIRTNGAALAAPPATHGMDA